MIDLNIKNTGNIPGVSGKKSSECQPNTGAKIDGVGSFSRPSTKQTATSFLTDCRAYQEVPHRVGWRGIDPKSIMRFYFAGVTCSCTV
jgi:hypothetical protein